LDIVELVMAFEEEFGVEVPDEDAEKLQTVGDVIKYIEEKSSKQQWRDGFIFSPPGWWPVDPALVSYQPTLPHKPWALPSLDLTGLEIKDSGEALLSAEAVEQGWAWVMGYLSESVLA